MKILYVSSEIAPFSRTGGLGDVAGSLPVALSELGAEVIVATPKYQDVNQEAFRLTDTGIDFQVEISDRSEAGHAWLGRLGDSIPVYLITHDHYFNREGYYGNEHGDYVDNAERFIFFSRAVLELMIKLGEKPDIIHCNDWQTAMIPLYLKTKYNGCPNFSEVGTVMTVHNLNYQGIFEAHDMHVTNLGWSYFVPEHIEYYRKINFLKGGLIFADEVNTVSVKYAEETQTEEYGCGLDGVLRKRKRAISGILNGVNYLEWNPATDRFIKAKYSPNEFYGKRSCKFDLQQEFGLEKRLDVTTIGVLSPLFEHKGFDLLADAFDEIMELDVQFVLIGSGEKRFEEFFTKAQEKYQDRVGIRLGPNEVITHKILAGSDILLIPSKFEPDGVQQIYALKYGTIPLVHASGGLDDAVKNFSRKSRTGNGFKFQRYTAGELLRKIKEAVALFRSDSEAWSILIQNGMSKDFSWKVAAEKYFEMYEIILDNLFLP